MSQSKSFNKVTKEEFDAFVAAYPVKLERNVHRAYEPPALSLNDFTTGDVWPESMRAYVVLQTSLKGHPLYKGEPDDFYILARKAEQ